MMKIDFSYRTVIVIRMHALVLFIRVRFTAAATAIMKLTDAFLFHPLKGLCLE